MSERDDLAEVGAAVETVIRSQLYIIDHAGLEPTVIRLGDWEARLLAHHLATAPYQPPAALDGKSVDGGRFLGVLIQVNPEPRSVGLTVEAWPRSTAPTKRQPFVL